MITLDNILKKVSKTLEVSISDIKSENKKREIVDARFVYCLLAKKYTTLSLQKIGEEINKTHGSVINSCKKAESDLQYSPLFRNKYNTVKSLVDNGDNLVVKDINLLELTQNYTMSFINFY